MKKKVLIIFGTRPEAIKLYPLIRLLKENKAFDIVVVNSGQQKEMLDQTIKSLSISVDYDLGIMTANQTLATLSSRLLIRLDEVYSTVNPNYLFIHGDTTTSMIAGILGKYYKIKIFHVEAGLRSHNIYSPWPEEMNRKFNAITSDFNLAPTEAAKKNLLAEGIEEKYILVTGNTGIDAIRLTIQNKRNTFMVNPGNKYNNNNLKNLVLITIHRRENFDKLREIFSAIKTVAETNIQIDFLYPVHLNPNVRRLAYEMLSETDNLNLVNPLDYEEFIFLLEKSYFVITDSGGIQEEATYLGKPIILCRDTTERPEGLTSQNIILAGTDRGSIIKYSNKLINDKIFYQNSSVPSLIFGDGYASERIHDFLVSVNEGIVD
jgi:UDP-N-acetylglucosamine 2-epimerase (non-hydrolysing)